MSTAAPLKPEAGRLLHLAPAEYRKTCDAAIATAHAEIERLKSMKAPRDTVQALEAFDRATAAISDAGGTASVVRNSHPDPAMREVADACEQELDKVSTEFALDRGIYDALAGLSLDGEDAATKKWVEKVLRDFRRAGVDKDEATRAKVKALNEELVRIGQEFGKNIRDDVRKIELDPKELEGLPADYVRAHAPGPNGKVTITTDYPDSVPFMTYARSGQAREQLWRVNRQRGYPKNLEVLQRLIEKRHELATLLGYPSWAAYVTEDKMIKTADNAADFIEKIARVSGPRAEKDYQTLLARKKVDVPNATRVESWDTAYLEDRVKAEQYAFDSQSVRPYFEYSRVKQGVLDTTAKLFGIEYRRAPDAKVWHPDVEAYDVLEDGELLGRFYLDMHPRENKYKHAAQFTLASGKRGEKLPEGVLMCNFPKPGREPALMQHSDVETFFHEFGHLLHHILGGHTRWAGLSGVRTEWDFVEAPSQMLEEWAWDPQVLQTFARHHETNAPIPTDLVKRMKAADEFGKGLYVRQQMFYAATSLSFYARDPKGLDTTALLKQLQEKYTPYQYVDGTYFHLSFGHLDGYSAIYYTYMWSLVIAKDLFTVFKQEGMLNRDAAMRYRNEVLAKGGSDDAAVLVKNFLGRDYGFEAYEKWLNAQ